MESRKAKMRKFAQNLLNKVRNYQPGRTDRGDFRKALLYIIELTEEND